MRVVDWFLPQETLADPEQRRVGRLIVVFSLLCLPYSLYFGIRDYLIEQYAWAAVILASCVLALAIPLLLRRTGRLVLAGNALAAVVFLQLAAQVVFGGGFQPEFILWMVVLPMGAMILGLRWSSRIWTVLIVMAVVVFYVLGELGVLVTDYALSSTATLRNLVGLVLLMGILLHLGDASRRLIQVDKERLERRLEQTRRLESVAQVAAGVTHEFNNLLTVIEGNAGLLLEWLGDDERNRPEVDEILDAARRGAALTGQLLAFTGQQTGQPTPLDVNATLRRLEPLIRRLLGEQVATSLELAEHLPPVLIDRSQVERVVINLALNSRDAMSSGGELIIETRLADKAPADLDDLNDLGPGPWVCVVVRDTGSGIASGDLQRIFEPFYSTKPRGEAAGLGLSTAYGIVRQAGGGMLAQSAPRRGTTMTIVLPPTSRPLQGEDPEPAARPREVDVPFVLLVDDQPMILRSATRILERRGFRVRTASSAQEAREVWRRDRERIDVVLTDVVMPDESGPTLARSLLAERPGLAVVLMSGYPARAIDEAVKSFPLIEKPFGPDELERVLRDAVRDSQRPA